MRRKPMSGKEAHEKMFGIIRAVEKWQYTPIIMSKIKKRWTLSSVGKDIMEPELLYTDGRVVKRYNHFGK